LLRSYIILNSYYSNHKPLSRVHFSFLSQQHIYITFSSTSNKMSSLFKDMLSSEETLFRDDVALSYDFTPKLVPYREAQQKYIASCIKPLLQDKNGKNLLILGSPGIGKTVTSKKVFDALREEEMDEDLYLFHINCWEHNTTAKAL